MSTALVTGATGQDGSYLVERLLDEGVEVHALVRDQSEVGAMDEVLAGRGQAHVGDLENGSGIAAAVAAARPTEVYSLGGISSVGFSWEHPEITAQVSGVGVLRLLDAVSAWAEAAGLRPRFVQASSAEMFGSPDVVPQTELTPIRPVSPYGAAKALGHHLVGVYRAKGMHASAAILYSHESPRRPHQFVTRKITDGAARVAIGMADEVVLGSLEVRRDWGWAPDYVDALVRIARAEAPDDFVVATGEAHSIAEFAAAAFARVGIIEWERYVRTDPRFVRPVDPGEQVGDASKLRAALGWSPTVPFAEVVGRMVDADIALLGAG